MRSNSGEALLLPPPGLSVCHTWVGLGSLARSYLTSCSSLKEEEEGRQLSVLTKLATWWMQSSHCKKMGALSLEEEPPPAALVWNLCPKASQSLSTSTLRPSMVR